MDWDIGKRRLGILLSGRGSNFEAIADSISNGRLDAEIVVVISNREDAPGIVAARERGFLAIVLPSKSVARTPEAREAYDDQLANVFEAHAVDFICLAGYMRVLSPPFIQRFPLGILNIHPSLLPSFAGLHVQQQALDYGVKFSGCTVHFVDEGLDSGPIIQQAVVPVLDDDNEDTLAARILKEEHRIYSEALELVVSGRYALKGRRVVGR